MDKLLLFKHFYTQVKYIDSILAQSTWTWKMTYFPVLTSDFCLFDSCELNPRTLRRGGGGRTQEAIYSDDLCHLLYGLTGH